MVSCSICTEHMFSTHSISISVSQMQFWTVGLQWSKLNTAVCWRTGQICLFPLVLCCHKMRSHFTPQKHCTGQPKSRPPLILLELEGNSELPDSVWFPETHDYFKQLHVRRSTNTGFICLILSQHKALGWLGKKRPQCHSWHLKEHNGPNFPSPSLQNPRESSHPIRMHIMTLHQPNPGSSPLKQKEFY